MSAVENFPVLLSEAEEESSAVPPCFSHEGINVRGFRYICFTALIDLIVPLHPPQQSLPARHNKKEHKCR
jgi:hypothetical protein